MRSRIFTPFWLFQSTLSVRRATVQGDNIYLHDGDFNPRSP